MKRLLLLPILAIVALVAGAVVAIADPGPKPDFYFQFPNLPGFTEPTQQQIADLAQSMLDPNAASGDNNNMASGFTYFGQFLDHDLTLDASPPPTAPEDPTQDTTNQRTFAFDLDSMYGPDDFTAHPEVYDAAGHFLLQEPNANGVRDYIRRADGSAVIFEGRNDENEIISQIQVAMMKAHNRLIDEGLSFENARQTLITAYQEAIIGDYLPHIAQAVDPKVLKKLDPKKTGTPLEFSVAAFRFGHSQVRRAYELNDDTGKIQVFSFTQPDLSGGRNIPAGRQIDWGEFFSDLPQPNDSDGVINISRKIDTLISSSLFQLPIPGAEATGSNVLAFRNMSRAVFYGLPSGQSVAGALGLPVYPPSQVANMPGFSTGTPLWYYILWESMQTTGGVQLGPVGSTIVRASFDAALKNGDKLVKGKTDPTALAELRGPDGTMTVSDLFVFAGVATR